MKRFQAKALYLKQYETGNPCKRGHVAPRWTSTGQCTVCLRDYGAAFGKSEKGKARYARYRASHRADLLARRRAEYAENVAANRRRQLRWRLMNPDRVSAYKKRYAAQHGEKIRAHRRSERGRAVVAAANHQRRARLMALPGRLSAAEIRLLRQRSNRCHLCGGLFTKADPATVDHVLPLTHEASANALSNVALAHLGCNSRKHASRFNPITGQGFLL